jgi:flavin-dependent dehydrogenase
LLAAAREAGAIVQLGARPAGFDARSNDAAGGFDIAPSAAGGDHRLHARFVVDASGRASMVARARGVARHAFDRLMAVAAYVKPGPGGPASDRATLIEAVEDGWWYSALLPADQMIVAYMTDADLMKHQLATAGGWSGLLRRAGPTRARVASHGSETEGEPRMVSASSSCLAAFAGAGWLAVGDAAASYDPLSSQGITVALSSGIEAAGAIAAQLGAGAGGSEALASYDRRRRRDFFDYLVLRAAYYALERRFPRSEFWRRRQPATRQPARHGLGPLRSPRRRRWNP